MPITKTAIGYKATCDDPQCTADKDCATFIDSVSATRKDFITRATLLQWKISKTGKCSCPMHRGE